MNATELQALQAPLKERYREDPAAAAITLRADAELDSVSVACSVQTGQVAVKAGLHPATGGDGTLACSGDMLLQALVACAGVTMRAVATSLGISIEGGTVTAEGDLDFRGTLAVEKSAPVGFTNIRLAFHLTSNEPQEKLDKLLELTLRYCVVYQTLASAPTLRAELLRA